MKREKAAARAAETPNIELRDIYHPPPRGFSRINTDDGGLYNNSSGESSGATLSGSSGADLLYGEGGGNVDPLTRRRRSVLPPTVMQAVIGVNFIAEHLKEQDEFNQIKQDWQFVAQVLDRLFMWMFAAVCLVGTFGIIVQAPTLYDGRTQLQFGRNVSTSSS